MGGKACHSEIGSAISTAFLVARTLAQTSDFIDWTSIRLIQRICKNVRDASRRQARTGATITRERIQSYPKVVAFTASVCVLSTDLAGSRDPRDLQACINNFKHLPPKIRAPSERAAPSRKVRIAGRVLYIKFSRGGCFQFTFFSRPNNGRLLPVFDRFDRAASSHVPAGESVVWNNAPNDNELEWEGVNDLTVRYRVSVLLYDRQ